MTSKKHDIIVIGGGVAGFAAALSAAREGSLKSDQATLAVSAIGKMAEYITSEHTAFGLRLGEFGDYAFSKSSPWQRMYELNAKKWYKLISAFHSSETHEEVLTVLDKMEKLLTLEIENAKNTIPLVEWDFRLAWEHSTEYTGDRENIE